MPIFSTPLHPPTLAPPSSRPPFPALQKLCWPTKFGSFIDQESGLWTLEWQLARWVVDAGVWTTAIPTQPFQPKEGRTLADGGVLSLSDEFLTAISEFAKLEHPRQYRLGLRAVNRAGAVSCGPSYQACRERMRKSATPWAEETECICPDPTGQVDNWAATQFDAGVAFMVDVVPPSCLFATAWVCDPRTPLGAKCEDLSFSQPFARPGTAQDGQQADTTQLHVQWRGFSDLDSGVNRCDLIVLQTTHPGVIGAGSECHCSDLMPYPACNCDAMPNGEPARCAVMSEYMRSFSSYTWRTSTEMYESQMGNLIADQAVDGKRVCMPGTPFNLGDRKLASGCDYDWECEPLTPAARAEVPPGSDHHVYCYPRSEVDWLGCAPLLQTTNLCCC